MRKQQTSRRRFLKGAVVAAVAPMIVRPSVLGAADGTPPPSERITMGFIGCGKQGSGHLTAMVRRSDLQLLAIADVQEEKRKNAREIIEKATGQSPNKEDAQGVDANKPWSSEGATTVGGPATKAGDVQYYNDFRDLLVRKDIDAVLIATPDHWHAIHTIEAARAGKDIYCEKPLTLTIREARDVIDAVNHFGRVFQVGSQQRSSREFRFACEMVRNGRIGRLKSVTVVTGTPSIDCDLPEEPVRKGVDWDFWLGPAPYRPFNKILCPPIEDQGWAMWRLYREFSGGAMTDFGAHHFDIAQWALAMDGSGPVEITPPEGGKDGKPLTFRYANGVEMYHGNTGLNFGGKGLTFVGTEGKIDVDRGKLETTPESIKRSPTHAGEMFLYKSVGHHEDWIRAIKTRRRQTVCPVEVGAHSVTVCHLGNICYWLNRPLRWDPNTWQFLGDDEANRWLDRPKRGNWTV
jgi:predicted dehydrogenase